MQDASLDGRSDSEAFTSVPAPEWDCRGLQTLGSVLSDVCGTVTEGPALHRAPLVSDLHCPSHQP